MNYTDKLSSWMGLGAALMPEWFVKSDTHIKYAVVGAGLGLVASSYYKISKNMLNLSDFDEFEELRDEFEKREKWFNRDKKR